MFSESLVCYLCGKATMHFAAHKTLKICKPCEKAHIPLDPRATPKMHRAETPDSPKCTCEVHPYYTLTKNDCPIHGTKDYTTQPFPFR